MNVVKTAATVIAVTIGAFAGFAATGAFADRATEIDPVLASFERAFNHEPVVASVAVREAIEDDVLYAELNSVHWSSPEQIVEVLGGCQSEVAEAIAGKSEAVRTAYLASCIKMAAR